MRRIVVLLSILTVVAAVSAAAMDNEQMFNQYSQWASGGDLFEIGWASDTYTLNQKISADGTITGTSTYSSWGLNVLGVFGHPIGFFFEGSVLFPQSANFTETDSVTGDTSTSSISSWSSAGYSPSLTANGIVGIAYYTGNDSLKLILGGGLGFMLFQMDNNNNPADNIDQAEIGPGLFASGILMFGGGVGVTVGVHFVYLADEASSTAPILTGGTDVTLVIGLVFTF